MSKAQVIAESFDLQRRNRLCNIPGCQKAPAKKVTLLEENRITRDSRILAVVCLCTHHYETRMPLFLTEINTEKETGKVVTKKVQEIGFVTC